MRLAALIPLLIAAPLAGQRAAPAFLPGDLEQVRVTARIVVVDREAFTRAGLEYAVVGADRVVVRSTGRRVGGGARVKVGTHGAAAFLEAVRASRWVRSESTQQVLTLSGRPAVVGSQDLTVGRRSTRTRGPTLAVVPTVLQDGSVHLHVAAALEDRARHGWGYAVDGSPASVDTEVIAAAGEEVIVGSGSWSERSGENGTLAWGRGQEERDVLVAVRVDVLTR